MPTPHESRRRIVYVPPRKTTSEVDACIDCGGAGEVRVRGVGGTMMAPCLVCDAYFARPAVAS